MKPIKKLSKKAAYSQKGVNGYKFPLTNKDAEVYLVDVKNGHDNYLISKKIIHTYYIISGKGVFDIGGNLYKVKARDLIEAKPKIEYTYSGKMKMLLIMTPPYHKGNDILTRKNPAVLK